MARTKASVGAKVAVGKSNKARCNAAPPPSIPSTSGTSKSSRNYSGGNPVCPRETPKWQKPITNFYVRTPSKSASGASDDEENEDDDVGPSKRKPNAIESDEDEEPEELPVNQALDETITLEPLSGESSHKIEEYYSCKNKGKGKKSNKENIDVNGNKQKRELEDGDDNEQSSKRVKIS